MTYQHLNRLMQRSSPMDDRAHEAPRSRTSLTHRPKECVVLAETRLLLNRSLQASVRMTDQTAQVSLNRAWTNETVPRRRVIGALLGLKSTDTSNSRLIKVLVESPGSPCRAGASPEAHLQRHRCQSPAPLVDRQARCASARRATDKRLHRRHLPQSHCNVKKKIQKSRQSPLVKQRTS